MNTDMSQAEYMSYAKVLNAIGAKDSKSMRRMFLAMVRGSQLASGLTKEIERERHSRIVRFGSISPN